MLQDPVYKSLSPAREPQLAVPDSRYCSFTLAGGGAGAGINLSTPLVPSCHFPSHRIPQLKPCRSTAPALPGCRTTLKTSARVCKEKGHSPAGTIPKLPGTEPRKPPSPLGAASELQLGSRAHWVPGASPAPGRQTGSGTAGTDGEVTGQGSTVR